MSRARLIVAAVAATAALLTARPASADLMCNDASKLPNPIIVSGSSAFEPMLRQFAVKLAAESPPSSIVYTGGAPACSAAADVINGKDLGGKLGVTYFFLDARTIDLRTCTFGAGQKADLALSEVFYESCSSLPRPRPADVMDVPGPVQASIFVAPVGKSGGGYLSYAEAQLIYGCGVSATRPIAGFSDPTQVLCRDPGVGQQTIIAKNIGLTAATLASPNCVDGATAAGVVGALTSATAPALGFIAAEGWDNTSTALTLLPFQSLGQTQAYALDSRPTFPDRRNVRDGHYTIWGYQHLIAKTSGGNPAPAAATLVGWITGANTSAHFDPAIVESTLGLIPQCAMMVKRSSDGGLLNAYAPPAPCHCAYEAATTQTSPPECSVCASNSQCSGGRICRRGFCE
jgi:hypothetical protein